MTRATLAAFYQRAALDPVTRAWVEVAGTAWEPSLASCADPRVLAALIDHALPLKSRQAAAVSLVALVRTHLRGDRAHAALAGDVLRATALRLAGRRAPSVARELAALRRWARWAVALGTTPRMRVRGAVCAATVAAARGAVHAVVLNVATAAAWSADAEDAKRARTEAEARMVRVLRMSRVALVRAWENAG